MDKPTAIIFYSLFLLGTVLGTYGLIKTRPSKGSKKHAVIASLLSLLSYIASISLVYFKMELRYAREVLPFLIFPVIVLLIALIRKPKPRTEATVEISEK